MARLEELEKLVREKQLKGDYRIGEGSTTSTDAIKVWREAMVNSYPDYYVGSFSATDKKWLKELVKEFGADTTTQIIRKVIGEWADFSLALTENKFIKGSLKKFPDVYSVYTLRSHAMNYLLGNLTAKAEVIDLVHTPSKKSEDKYAFLAKNQAKLKK